MIALRQRFGRLVVTSAPMRSSVDGKLRHACRCACDRTVYVLPGELLAGAVTSCGCDRPAAGAAQP